MSRRNYAARLRRLQQTQGVRTYTDPNELGRAWKKYKKTQEESLRNQLVEHYLHLVRFTAERIRAKLPDEVDVEDLMSAGIFGLVDAVDAFDLDRGVKFETYCAPRIRGAILDELRSMDWVPRLVRHRAHVLDSTVRMLEAELGRAPTEPEIAARLKLPKPQFEKLVRDANAVSLVSLSQNVNEGDSDREVAEVEVVPDEASADPVIEAQKADIKEFINRQLSRAEQLIIVLYYYEQMTMKEIGETLDLSESRVSQMHSAIIERLRTELELPEADLAAQTDLIA